MTLPIILTTAGLQPQAPSSFLAQLLAAVAATNPGYTATLPASLVEDVSSTDVGALVIIDQIRVDAVNSLSPFAANAFTLNQLGQIYGTILGLNTNTSVLVVFTGTSGFPIPAGFTVSDGTNQYTIIDGGIVGGVGTGSTPPLFALAVNPGTFAVPANTVTTIVTSVPSNITLSVTNPIAGTPATGAETEEDYRTRTLQAGLVAAQGMPRMMSTLLGNIPGVQTRLVSVLQQSNGFEVICGGGDPNAVAQAIYQAMFDISRLVGSTLLVTGITAANPMVVTTNLNHGYNTGRVVSLTGAVPSAYNFTNQTATVISNKTFSVPINATGFGAYTSGGIVTPNLRNATGLIIDFPDVYSVPFVSPPQQLVLVTVTWNTTATNFVNTTAIQQLGAPALAAYINSLFVGVPMNQNDMRDAFRNACATALAPSLMTRLVFTVTIAGVVTAPNSGTDIIVGDPESYFFTDPAGANITVVQG
jgi:hypothetical protein